MVFSHDSPGQNNWTKEIYFLTGDEWVKSNFDKTNVSFEGILNFLSLLPQ